MGDFRARIGAVELAYEVAGVGPRLVWCHGLASCREGDRDVIDALAAHFTVLAYDARGHGASSPVRDPAAFTYRALTEDLAGLLDHLGWDHAILAGASMGAGTVSRLAMIEPRRAAALVMVRPGSDGGAAPPWLQQLFRAGSNAIRSGGIEGAIEFLLGIPLARDELVSKPERIEGLRRDWGRHDPLSIAAAIEGIPASAPLGDGLDPGRITAPTLVVPGSDVIHPTEAGRSVARMIPGAVAAPPFDAAPRGVEVRELVRLIVDLSRKLL